MTYKILLIDAEAVQRDLLSHFLQSRLGYQAFPVSTLSEGLACFADNVQKPDLILLDWRDDFLSGAADCVKQLASHAPMVVLVKYGDYGAALMAVHAGAQDFLTKPIAMERVNITFRNLLLLRDTRAETERLRRQTPLSPLMATSHVQPLEYAKPSLPLIGEDGNIRRMQHIEEESIRFAMQYYHGRMTEVARRLGIGRSTLYRKLSELNIRQAQAA